MKRCSKKLSTWIVIAVMLFSLIGAQCFIPQPVLAVTPSQSLTEVLGYYQTNNYSNATSWWDMVGLWGAGDTHQTSWDGTATGLPGNILGILAQGGDPSNLVTELNVTTQDSMAVAFPGPYGETANDQIWAIVALDAAGAQYDEDKAVANLLTYQNTDGAFFYSVAYNTSDPDTTGMALIALANHPAASGVQTAITNAKAYLQSIQENTGGFSSWGMDNPNSDAAIISGLTAIGEDPLSDEWTKNGNTMVDDLVSFQLADGSFESPYNPGQADAMATYQALVALGDLDAGQSVWQRLMGNGQQNNNDSAIVPGTAVFDKKTSNQANISVTLTLNGNILYSVANGGTLLTAGTDYTVSGNTATIYKMYLAQQETGTTTLTFNFSDGTAQNLAITVSDSTSNSQPLGSITLSVDGRNGNIISASATVSLGSGDTPYSVLVKKLGQGNITVSGSGSSLYVTGINGTNAGDDGPTSGWMYSVNGVYPGVGAASKTLSDQDVVVWRYTTNLGQDIGSSSSVGSTGGTTPLNQGTLDVLKSVTAEQKAQAALPDSTPAVSPESGTATILKTNDGVQIVIPPGALSGQSSSIRFAVQIGNITTPPSDPDTTVLDPLDYQRQFGIENALGGFQENEISFQTPVTISFPIVSGDLPEGVTSGQLAIYWWDPDNKAWINMGGVFDAESRTISIPVYHFSTYAVMADTGSVPKRLSGDDRFLTGNAVADQGWEIGSEEVVLVNVQSYADALASVPLAFKLNAPILLTEAGELTPSTQQEIQKLGAKKVTIIGGTGVISKGVQDQLEKAYGIENITRLGGNSRYETASQIAAALGTIGKAILANGDAKHYADALAISGYAAYNGIPILFTETNSLPAVTRQVLTDCKVAATIVVGGEDAVSANVYKQLQGADRYGSSNRYATATAIAEGLELNTSRVYVTTGLDFADALTAGNLAARTLSPLIMVDQDIPEASSNYLTDYRQNISNLIIVGGEGAISSSQEDKLRAIINELQAQTVSVTRTQVDAVINQLVSWEQAYIRDAFSQTESGEIVDPSVHNWTTIGLGRLDRVDTLSAYIEETEKAVSQNWNSVSRKVTDLARISLAVGAAQRDPHYFGGKDLIAAIYNFSNIEAQGINGPVSALIALDSGEYEIPASAKWKRESLLEIIMKKQLADGGFSLSGTGESDPDITAMVLQSLAPYNTDAYPDVQAVVKKALANLSANQEKDGGFISSGIKNSESVCQVMIALCSLGIDIDNDTRFIKNGNTLLVNLLQYQAGDGGFKHTLDGTSNAVASEQAILALAAYVCNKDLNS